MLYSHEGIKEAVVIGVPDAKTGEAVHAYIVPGDGELTEQAVFDYCETHLAKYYMMYKYKNTYYKLTRHDTKLVQSIIKEESQS